METPRTRHSDAVLCVGICFFGEQLLWRRKLDKVENLFTTALGKTSVADRTAAGGTAGQTDIFPRTTHSANKHMPPIQSKKKIQPKAKKTSKICLEG